MEHDAWFFIGVFVFIFLIWIATGGPTHPISFTGPSLAQPQELGGGTYLQFPRAPFAIGSTYVTLPGSSNGKSTYTLSNSGMPGTSPQTDVPPPIYGIYFGIPSPYRNMVSLNNYVSSASSTDEYVELSVAQNASASVTITKWALESEATGNAEIIPRGTAVPTSGIVNAESDIVLSPGDRAIISTGPSPVGASFRENKCIGYFSSFQKFSPPLPQNCPSPSDELLASYGTPYIHDPSCIDYTNTLSRCEVLTSKVTKINRTCENFLENTLTYNGCVRNHKSDANFNGNTWRIYLGRVDKKGKTVPMWRTKHEVVKLLDDRGKTVGQFTY